MTLGLTGSGRTAWIAPVTVPVMPVGPSLLCTVTEGPEIGDGPCETNVCARVAVAAMTHRKPRRVLQAPRARARRGAITAPCVKTDGCMRSLPRVTLLARTSLTYRPWDRFPAPAAFQPSIDTTIGRLP